MGGVLEVDEVRPDRGAEHVPRVRFTVKQLPWRAPVDEGPLEIPAAIDEQAPVRIRVREVWGDVAARDILSDARDAIHDVRRRDLNLPKAAMKSLQRLGTVGRWNHRVRHRFEVGPERDLEVVTHQDT